MLPNFKVALLLALIAFISGCSTEKTLDHLVQERKSTSLHHKNPHWGDNHGDILKKHTGVPTVEDIEGDFKRLLEDYPEGHPEERHRVEKARDALAEAKEHKSFSDIRQLLMLKDYKNKLYKFQTIKEKLL